MGLAADHNSAMTLADRLCLSYLKLGRGGRNQPKREYVSPTDPLRPLLRRFPTFLDDIKAKRVVDFGCAQGTQSFAFADAGASEVLGVEILDRRLEMANARLKAEPRPGMSFVKALGSAHANHFDIVVSLNSFEHFSDPDETLREICDVLRPGGRLFLTFGPPWWSAFGPHQTEFTFSPWPQLLFNEPTFMKARGILMNDPQKHTYADRWLNQMSVTKYERIVKRSRFKVVRQEYHCSRGLDAVKGIPAIRELAINRIVSVLEKAAHD